MRDARWIGFAIGLCVAGCSAPSLHSLHGPDALIQAPELLGAWATDGPIVARVEVTAGSDGKYAAVLTVERGDAPITELQLEVSVTQIGSDRYVDLYPARSERQELASHYGFLALPVHQVMMFRRDGDVLLVWAFHAGWLRQRADQAGFACEVLPIGGHEVAVITADTGSLRGFLKEHAHDEGARLAPFVFRRAS